jgi:hypothetical protein
MNPFDIWHPSNVVCWFQRLSDGSEADRVNGTPPERSSGKGNEAKTTAPSFNMPPSLRRKVDWEPCGPEPFTGLSLGTKFGERAEHECRTEAEVEELVQHWKRYVHPRARDFDWKLDEVLANIARQLPRGEDPITGSQTSCVYWRGDTERNEAGVYESITTVEWHHGRKKIFTNRLLAFLFATSESMNVLMTLPKRPFLMGCQHQLCVCVSHIDMEGARLRICSPEVHVKAKQADEDHDLAIQQTVAVLQKALQDEAGAQVD